MKITMEMVTNAEKLALAFAEKVHGTQPDPVEEDQQVVKLREAINNMRSLCSQGRKDVTQLVSILIGKDIPATKDSDDGLALMATPGALFVARDDDEDEDEPNDQKSVTFNLCYTNDSRPRMCSCSRFGDNNFGRLENNEVRRWATVEEVGLYFNVIKAKVAAYWDDFDSACWNSFDSDLD